MEPHLLGKGLGLRADYVVEITHRDYVAQLQGLPLVYQQHEHYLQRSAFPLQRRGEGHQRLHQGGAEGIEATEHLTVALAGQQQVECLFPHLLGFGKRLIDLDLCRSHQWAVKDVVLQSLADCDLPA